MFDVDIEFYNLNLEERLFHKKLIKNLISMP
jgi:hypothetical protein